MQDLKINLSVLVSIMLPLSVFIIFIHNYIISLHNVSHNNKTTGFTRDAKGYCCYLVFTRDARGLPVNLPKDRLTVNVFKNLLTEKSLYH